MVKCDIVDWAYLKVVWAKNPPMSNMDCLEGFPEPQMAVRTVQQPHALQEWWSCHTGLTVCLQSLGSTMFGGWAKVNSIVASGGLIDIGVASGKLIDSGVACGELIKNSIVIKGWKIAYTIYVTILAIDILCRPNFWSTEFYWFYRYNCSDLINIAIVLKSILLVQ